MINTKQAIMNKNKKEHWNQNHQIDEFKQMNGSDMQHTIWNYNKLMSEYKDTL